MYETAERMQGGSEYCGETDEHGYECKAGKSIVPVVVTTENDGVTEEERVLYDTR